MADPSYKIVVIGLDNAGKTSIILSMAWRTEPFNMKPTEGIERTDMRVLGFPVFRWDLGGQIAYRKTYLKERSFVLNESDLIIYVVDLTDSSRFEESLKYYKEMLEYLNKIKLNPPIIIFLHKTDPIFMKSSDYPKNLQQLNSEFKLNSKGFKIELFTTSVYDRKTLVEAFSRSLSKIFPKLIAFNTLLQDFIAQHELNAAMLFDDNFHLIGRAFKDEEDQTIQEIYEIYYLFEGFIRLRKYGYELDLNLAKVGEQVGYQIKVRPLHLGNWKLFILLAGSEISDINALLDTLKQNFEAKKDEFAM